MTLKFNTVLEVVELHVHATFHEAKCNGSWVIVVTEKTGRSNNAENNTVIVTTNTNKYSSQGMY